MVNVKLSQTYQDLLLGLKNESGTRIYPRDTNYSNSIKEWIKKIIYHDQELLEEDISWIEKFTDNFVRKSREIWKKNDSKVYHGRNPTVNAWLEKLIPIHYTCNCSECIGEDEKMEIDEEPKGQSKS